MQKFSLFLWLVYCPFLFAICLFSENISWFSSSVITAQTVSTQNQELEEARKQSAEVQRLIAERKFDEALPLAERVLTALQLGLWAEHPEVATALTRLATIHRNKGDLAKALSFNQRALTIAERVVTPGHPELGQIVTEMGVIYFQQNDLVRAEEAFLRALEIWKSLKPTDSNIVRVTGNLAAVYGTKYDFAQSRSLLEPLVKAIEKEGGPEDPRLINPLINLGTGYFQEYKFAEAEPYYRRVIKISEKLPREKPPAYAGAISSLGSIMTTRGEFTESEKLQRQALALRGGSEKETPEVGDSLSLLAINFAYQGRFAEAESLQLQSLAIAEKNLGPEHPNVAHRLNSLMHFHTARGDFAKAITTLTRATEVSELGLAYNIAAGSEREKLAYLSTFDNETNRTVSLHIEFAPENAAARTLALTTVLRRKARALDAMIDSLEVLRRRATPEDSTLLKQLQEVRSDIAKLVIRPLPPRTTRADQQKRLRELNEQREKLEAGISRSSAEFRAQSQPVTPAAIQAAIPENAALVEFIVYRPFNSKFNRPQNQFGAPYYAAYVLQHTGAERWVKLGRKSEIDEAIEKLRKALRNRRRRDVKLLARAVDKLIMQPVRPLLGQSRRVLLAPDGSLNLVPFAVLVDERNQYLIQNYTFSYLSSGRDLLRLAVKAPRQRTALILTNPDFGPGSGNASADERILRYRTAVSGDLANGAILADAYFPPLPATADEATALKTLMPEAELLAQGQATETALKAIAAPGILHVATHGFFLGDPGESGQRGPSFEQDAVPAGNPLLRSGLALAGANTLMSGKDDGILTALEAAGLNLWGTNLVVLSACDTGVGEVKTGEGVYGLRRALLLAGSETQVMSLWPVSDKGTRDLMI
ncbi:MAG TPA: CHAT domain-containing protein, partial [Blastocatellia bacterium]|nr:CHAT domain-containing protein [Blastocatellia bacterium]